jgi:hypothetical protein
MALPQDELIILVAQSIVSFFSFLIMLLVAKRVSEKEDYILNKVFAIASVFIALSMITLSTGNIPVIFSLGEFTVIFVQFFYLFLVIGLSFFVMVGMLLKYGKEIAMKQNVLAVLVLIGILNAITIFLPDSITLSSPGNTVTSTLFKIVFFGTMIFYYLFIFLMFALTYRVVAEDIKPMMKLFLVGWSIGGIALVLNVFSDFYRLLDVMSPGVLTLGLFLVERGFVARK